MVQTIQNQVNLSLQSTFSKWPMNQSVSFFSTPFDVTTVNGYFGYLSICYIIAVSCILLQVTVLSFFIGSCLFLEASCWHFRTIFDQMDDLIKDQGNFDRLKFMKLLTEIIEFHIHIKRHVFLVILLVICSLHTPQHHIQNTIQTFNNFRFFPQNLYWYLKHYEWINICSVIQWYWVHGLHSFWIRRS